MDHWYLAKRPFSDKVGRFLSSTSFTDEVLNRLDPEQIQMSKNATEALQFYEDCVDSLPYIQTSEKDNGFDWDMCRAYCCVGKSYSHSRFMEFVAKWFKTTVSEMKNSWRHIKHK